MALGIAATCPKPLYTGGGELSFSPRFGHGCKAPRATRAMRMHIFTEAWTIIHSVRRATGHASGLRALHAACHADASERTIVHSAAFASCKSARMAGADTVIQSVLAPARQKCPATSALKRTSNQATLCECRQVTRARVRYDSCAVAIGKGVAEFHLARAKLIVSA